MISTGLHASLMPLGKGSITRKLFVKGVPPPGPPRTRFFRKVNGNFLTEKGGTPLNGRSVAKKLTGKKLTKSGDILCLVAMDQNLKDGDFLESGVDIPLRNTNNVGEKSSATNVSIHTCILCEKQFETSS